MKINVNKRILACKKLITKLEKELNLCNPYGYTDCQLIYNDLMYWSDLLDRLANTVNE